MDRTSQAEAVIIADVDDLLAPEGAILEVPLLMSDWQMAALERAAHRNGVTAGELLRHLLHDFLAHAGERVGLAVAGKVGPA
jgi:hypothetical protein